MLIKIVLGLSIWMLLGLTILRSCSLQNPGQWIEYGEYSRAYRSAARYLMEECSFRSLDLTTVNVPEEINMTSIFRMIGVGASELFWNIYLWMTVAEEEKCQTVAVDLLDASDHVSWTKLEIKLGSGPLAIRDFFNLYRYVYYPREKILPPQGMQKAEAAFAENSSLMQLVSRVDEDLFIFLFSQQAGRSERLELQAEKTRFLSIQPGSYIVGARHSPDQLDDDFTVFQFDVPDTPAAVSLWFHQSPTQNFEIPSRARLHGKANTTGSTAKYEAM